LQAKEIEARGGNLRDSLVLVPAAPSESKGVPEGGQGGAPGGGGQQSMMLVVGGAGYVRL
jgi:hypothetical protein